MTRSALALCLLAACTPSRTTYVVHEITSPLAIDGDLTDWPPVPIIDGFTRSSGEAPSRLHTTARAAFDTANLYVAFTTEDPDIRATATAHDAPIYREEAVEMFIEPVPGSGNYIELQSSPLSVTFDASFTGGPRQNMRRDYNADFTAACITNGTPNNPIDTDQSWTCEWRITLASLPNVQLPLTNTTTWHANFFRIAKDRPPTPPTPPPRPPPARGKSRTGRSA